MRFPATPAIPNGSFVMLTDEAPKEVYMSIGREAVLKVVYQSCRIEGHEIIRTYLCQHLHRGRLTLDHVPGGMLDELWLRAIPREQAQAQMMLYNAQAEEGGILLAGMLEL